MEYILGLDLGTNSVGWAVVELSKDRAPCSLLDCGVRIFDSPLEPKTRTPLNAARRAARLQRRQLSRRKRRKIALTKILQ